MSFYYGFTNWKGIGDYKFIGLKNFRYLLKDGTLVNSLKNTFHYAIVSVTSGNIMALILALVVNMKLKLKGAFRVAFYIPALFSTVVVGFIWSYVFAPYYGLIYNIFEIFGKENWFPNLLADARTALTSVAMVDRWKTCGTMTLIYLAGLQNLSEEVLESAKIDGCRWYQELFRVKIPMLANTIIINVMLGLIGGFKAFDFIYTMTGGGPGSSTTTLMYSVYQIAFIENQYGKAEALAASAFLLILVVSVSALLLMRRKEIEV